MSAEALRKAAEASRSPRVDALIERVMQEHPGFSASAQSRYYEAVHQELAPLARDQEAEIATHRANYDALVIRLGEVTARLEAWRTLVVEHNAACESACDMDRCGYRPYFENNGRRCSECPYFDAIDIPDNLKAADHV